MQRRHPRAANAWVLIVAGIGVGCASCGNSGASSANPDAFVGADGAPTSSANSITSFAFLKHDNAVAVDSVATITGNSIALFLPPGTPVTALKAAFSVSPNATVTVGATPQTSGVTANDFTTPVSYRVTAQDGSTQTYTVSLTTDIAAFDDVITAFMAKYAVPAVSIAVTHDDKLIYVKAYGLSDKEASTSATPASLFRLASVSKPITSVALMRLIEQGKVHLGDTVFGPGGILGTAYGTAPYGPHITEITVDQLLHHTSGGWPNDASDPMFKNPTMTAAQLIGWALDNAPLLAAPGTKYQYSNFGYCILGRVIEKITGQPYEDAVKSLVLTPIGVTDMAIDGNTLAERLPNEVKYYGQSGEDPYSFNLRRMDSHGGWVATAKDLASFLASVDGFSGKPDLLQSATLTTMTTPSSVNATYACGWSVNSSNNWWHMGSLPGNESEIIRAATGWNWVMLTNTRSTDASFAREFDQLFWTAFGKLNAYPAYDLF